MVAENGKLQTIGTGNSPIGGSWASSSDRSKPLDVEIGSTILCMREANGVRCGTRKKAGSSTIGRQLRNASVGTYGGKDQSDTPEDQQRMKSDLFLSLP